jgi:drug/metabolite transporter (DMT)-like permease
MKTLTPQDVKLPNELQKISIKPTLALGLVYLIWGTTMAAMHVGIQTMHPALLTCLRFTLAGILLLIFCALRKEPFPSRQDIQKHFLIGFLLFFAGNSLSSWALQNISTGLGGMVIATTPFWMIGLAAIGPKKEPISKQAFYGIALGFVGLLILFYPNLGKVSEGPLGVSILCLLIVSFFWSVGSLVAKHTTVKTSVLMGLGLQNIFAGLLLSPICLISGGFQADAISLPSWGALFYLVLMGTILATPCYYYVLKNMSTSVASTFAYVNPIVTLIFGWIFLEESLTFNTVLGAVIVILGVLWVQQEQKAPKHSHE